MINQDKTKKPATPARPNGSTGRAGLYHLYAIDEIFISVISYITSPVRDKILVELIKLTKPCAVGTE